MLWLSLEDGRGTDDLGWVAPSAAGSCLDADAEKCLLVAGYLA